MLKYILCRGFWVIYSRVYASRPPYSGSEDRRSHFRRGPLALRPAGRKGKEGNTAASQAPRQVVDHRDGSENGVAIDIDCRSLVGSQSVPYIFEDYATPESIASALFKFYEIPKNEKDELGKKVRNYVSSEFDYKDVISEWHESLMNVSRTWKDTYKRWETYTI